jgi:hypothetical protein
MLPGAETAVLGQRLILRLVDRQEDQAELFALSGQPIPIPFELVLSRFGFRLHLNAENTQKRIADYKVKTPIGRDDLALHGLLPLCVRAVFDPKQGQDARRIALALDNPSEPVRVRLLAVSRQPSVRAQFQFFAQRVADARIQRSLGLRKQAAQTLAGYDGVPFRGGDHPTKGIERHVRVRFPRQ